MRNRLREMVPDSDRGYTLLEMVLVLAIAAFLLSIIVPRFMRDSVDAKIAKTKAGLEKIRTAIELYRADTGMTPTSSTMEDDLTKTGPPYLDEIPEDGFAGGTDIFYADDWDDNPPCNGPPYGGWCCCDGLGGEIKPNLPCLDPDYGNEDFKTY